MSNAKLLAEAMALPEADREELAAALLDSLEPPPGAISIDAVDEFERRADELLSGRVIGVPWDEVKAGLKG